MCRPRTAQHTCHPCLARWAAWLFIVSKTCIWLLCASVFTGGEGLLMHWMHEWRNRKWTVLHIYQNFKTEIIENTKSCNLHKQHWSFQTKASRIRILIYFDMQCHLLVSPWTGWLELLSLLKLFSSLKNFSFQKIQHYYRLWAATEVQRGFLCRIRRVQRPSWAHRESHRDLCTAGLQDKNTVSWDTGV